MNAPIAPSAPLLHPSFVPGWSKHLPTALDALIAKLATPKPPTK